MIGLSACGSAPPLAEAQPSARSAAPAERAPEAHVVDVIALDYALAAPAEIPSGWTTFRLTNRGSEPHYFVLSRLKADHTIDDFLTAWREREPLLPIVGWPLGGPNAPVNGTTSVLTMNLQPGEYVMACWWPSLDHVPHVAKGMTRPLTVTEEISPGEKPEADVELVMRDFDLDLSGSVRPGRQTIRVSTDSSATEAHELFLARLEPGQSAEELEEWFSDWLVEGMRGEPPAELLTGVGMMRPGETVFLTVDFEPGEYVLICPLPSRDGEMHSVKGMIQQFSVEAA